MITAEQHERDKTWLNVPTIEAINAGLGELQAALDAAYAELDRLGRIVDNDPGYCAVSKWPAPWRFIETTEAKEAWEKIQTFQKIPVCSRTATDYIRRRPNKSKQKYPLPQWAKLSARLLRWAAK